MQEYNHLRSNALDLAAEAEKLRPEQFENDFDAGIRKLDSLQKRCMVRTNSLMNFTLLFVITVFFFLLLLLLKS